MIRSIHGLCFAALVVCSQAISVAQEKLPTGEEVMAKWAKATASPEKLKSLKTLVVTSKISIPAVNMSGKSVAKSTADGKGVMNNDFGGQKIRVGSDGTTAWMEGPNGKQVMEGEQASLLKYQACMLPMVDFAKFFDSVKCTKKESFGEEDCYVVECKNGDGKPLVQYFSVKSGLMTGMKMAMDSPMGEIEITVDVGDYKEVDGYKWSHKTTVNLPGGMQQVTEVESIQTNVEIDASEFVSK